MCAPKQISQVSTKPFVIVRKLAKIDVSRDRQVKKMGLLGYLSSSPSFLVAYCFSQQMDMRFLARAVLPVVKCNSELTDYFKIVG